MHVSWLGFGCDFRTDFVRIPSFHTHSIHHSAVHERQSAQGDAPTRGPAACARRTAPRTRHASSSAARMRVLTRGNRSESLRLPSTTSIARSPPDAIPARRCGATPPAAKGRHRTSAGAAPHARYQRGRASAHALRRSRLAVEGAQSDGSSCEQRRPPGHQSCACRCGGAWAGAAHERGTMAACRDALPRRAPGAAYGLKGREVRGRTDGTLSSRAQRPVHSRRHAWWTAYTE